MQPLKHETSTQETRYGMRRKKAHGGDLLFLNLVKWTKNNLYWKSLSFLQKGRSNTVCEIRVAWVWLFQRASACHCLPSQLLQAPVPWLPYMRDQGLPRCFWERRAQCEGGTNQSTKYSFPLHVRSPSGDSDGVTDTAAGVDFFLLLPFSPWLFLMKTVACLSVRLQQLSAARTVWGWIMCRFCPKESLFRLCSSTQRYLV